MPDAANASYNDGLTRWTSLAPPFAYGGLVLAIDPLAHSADPSISLAALRRSLAPGGVISHDGGLSLERPRRLGLVRYRMMVAHS